MFLKYNINNYSENKIINDYIENGCVVVEDIISNSENFNIISELKKINKGDYKCNEIKPTLQYFSDESLISRYMYIGQPHVLSEKVHSFIFHNNITKILDRIVGVNVPFWDGSYKCVQTMFVTKKPGSNGSPWHQDEHPIPTRDRSLVGVWLALEDTTVENSCLWYIPNSHKKGIIYERYEHNEPDVDSMPIARGFDISSQMPIEMRSNSALFFSGYLLHSSKKNFSDSYRPALTLHYCTSSTLLSWQGENNYRGIVQIKGTDPYISEGYTKPNLWVKKE